MSTRSGAKYGLPANNTVTVSMEEEDMKSNLCSRCNEYEITAEGGFYCNPCLGTWDMGCTRAGWCGYTEKCDHCANKENKKSHLCFGCKKYEITTAGVLCNPCLGSWDFQCTRPSWCNYRDAKCDHCANKAVGFLSMQTGERIVDP